MGTTTKTSGSNTSNLQFNPISQGIYNNLIQGGGKQLGDMINNPFGNALYSMGLGQSQKGAQQQGANNMGVLNQNQRVQGLGGQAGAGWLAAQKAMTGRANASMMSNANVSNVMSALQRQMAATGMGMSFSPQLTGQTGNFSQQQSTGGLGTWLPQLAGAALGAAGGFLGGGGMGAAMHATGAGASGGPTSLAPSSSFSGFGIGSGANPNQMSFNPMAMQSMQGMF